MIKIDELLKKQNKKQKDLAAFCETSDQVIGHYKNGRNEPSIEMLIKIANFFDVSVDCLINRKETEQHNKILNDREQLLLNIFRELNNTDQAQAIGIIQGMAGITDLQKYKRG